MLESWHCSRLCAGLSSLASTCYVRGTAFLRAKCRRQLFGLYRFSGVERLKDKAAAAAQAILEPGIATDGGQQMSRQQFGTFVRRFAAASGLSFSAITDFLLVVPVFDYDPAFMDPGEPDP